MTWMKLEMIMLNEISEVQKDKYYVISLIGILKSSIKLWVEWWLPEAGESGGEEAGRAYSVGPKLGLDSGKMLWCGYAQ